jgi:hypothetical protein
MRFDKFSFGSLEIDGSSYEHDVVIDRGRSPNARKSSPRNSASSSAIPRCWLRKRYPGSAANLSLAPARTASRRMQEVRREAERRRIKLLMLPTLQAIEMLNQNMKDTNALLHVTC